ncbi:MAG: bifunctional ornithine acetyltransferase/N-acetylglutamate synthase, partial [Pseudobdellovibrio sp.]
TGVIGVTLPLEKILRALPVIARHRRPSARSFAELSLAICTTDTRPKTASSSFKMAGKRIHFVGCAKGAGMIHPNMATMLGYILTDAQITKGYAAELIKKSSDLSFNMISVDGDSSTNDCNFLMANGASGVEVKTPEDFAKFEAAVNEISIFLAKSIAADGEGATKLIEVEIKGSDNLELARKAARGVTLSPLIKTAIHGEDSNWGRILARLGAEKVPATQLEKMTLHLQGVLLFEKGRPVAFEKAAVKALLKQAHVKIEIDLKSGPMTATAWGCDLSKKYVEINTEYS